MNNAHVYYPLNVIIVTFDKAIKTGPGINNISVNSSELPSETKMTYNSVSGNQLLIVPNSPINIPLSEPEGIPWQVHLPNDAVTDLSGNPLDQDYSWSFTMGGGAY